MALTIPAAFPTTAALKLAMQAVQANSQTPPAVSDDVIDRARAASYQEIIARLVQRGFSKTQIDQWDRLAEFGTHIALWWIWRERIGANQGGDFSGEAPAHWDRREELDTVFVTIDGEEVDEDDDANAGVGYGRMDTSDDTFVYGETQW